MSFKSEIEGAISELATETAQVLIWHDLEIPWIPNMEEVGTDIVIGPSIERISASGNILKSYFITADTTEITADSDVILADNDTPRPRSGKKGEFRGKTYRVLTVSEDASGAYFHLRLASSK